MLRAESLTLSYGRGALVRDLSLALEPGRTYGLVAPNGSGKTTLLRALADLPGARVVGGVDVDGLDPRSAERHRRVFYAPGDATLLYPGLTGRAHLKMARELWRSSADVREVERACDMEDFATRRVRRYSQGMKQQLTLALAYETQARYLLLDEPMNALDPTNVKLQSDLVRRAADEGSCVVMSSHILDNVDRACDVIWFLKEGRLLELGRDVHAASALEAYDELFVGRVASRT